MNRAINFDSIYYVVRQVIQVHFSKDAPLSHKSKFSGQNVEEILLDQEDPTIDKPQKCISFCPPVQADCTAVQLYKRAVPIHFESILIIPMNLFFNYPLEPAFHW